MTLSSAEMYSFADKWLNENGALEERYDARKLRFAKENITYKDAFTV